MDYKDDYGFSSYETDEDNYDMYKTNDAFIDKGSNNIDDNNKVNSKKKGPSKIYFVILCIAFLITSLSVTVAFFSASARSNLIQEIESAVVNFSLKVEKVSEDTDKGLVPVKDSEINKALSGTNGKKCVDVDGNNVCQIYKINVENASEYSTIFKGTLLLSATENSNYENLKWAEITYSENPTVFGTIKPMSDLVLKESYGIGGGATATFYIVVWISDNGNVQNESDYGSFVGNVTFEAVSGDKLTSTFSSK